MGMQLGSTLLFSLQNGARDLCRPPHAILERRSHDWHAAGVFWPTAKNFAARAEALVNKGIEFRMLGLHLERLSDIVGTPREEGLDLPASDLRTVAGSLTLDHVCFRYAANDRPVFENLNLSIEPGEFIAITGCSGGGKTTLLKVMLGLLPPDSGNNPYRRFTAGHLWAAKTGGLRSGS